MEARLVKLPSGRAAARTGVSSRYLYFFEGVASRREAGKSFFYCKTHFVAAFPRRKLCVLGDNRKPVFEGLVKKTYLTLLGLTAVLASKIKGFVPEKNRFREAVKKRPFLLKWPNERALSREWN
jgi:hypothetical protein